MQMGHWKQLRVHLLLHSAAKSQQGSSLSAAAGDVRPDGVAHLFPSLLMLLLGTSNKQLGQK